MIHTILKLIHYMIILYCRHGYAGFLMYEESNFNFGSTGIEREVQYDKIITLMIHVGCIPNLSQGKYNT